MANPFTSGLRQQANSATTAKNSLNEPNKHSRLTHNTFNRSYIFASTFLYSDIRPFYVDDGVSGDKNPLYSTHELKAPTLKAPMMSGLSMKKGYFAVPYKAMLPLNFDKVFVQPKKGDDVLDNVGTVFNFSSSTFLDNISSEGINDYAAFTRVLKGIFLLEMFFSSGSLLHHLGYKLSSTYNPIYVDGEEYKTFDDFFDAFFAIFLSNNFRFRIYDDTDALYYYYSVNGPFEIGDIVVSHHRAVELMRYNPNFEVVSIDGESDFDNTSVHDIVNEYLLAAFFGQHAFCTFDDRPLDFSRLLAYQLSTSVFFSNDDIDYIYTANLYRQNQISLYSASEGSLPKFNYNGIRCEYDVLSGFCVENALKGAIYYCFADDGSPELYYFIHNIFSFQKSLRFGDYYLGARLNPLALGDVNAPVVNSNVSAIDMTKSISIQKFANFVNKIPSTIAGYLRDMFHVESSADLTEPSYLGVTKSNIGGFEVENTTSDEQGKLVTNLAASGGDFAFEVDIADPCVIIGLCWFEQPRIYSGIIERQMLHRDRFDKFQPMLQYIGDQDIKACEYYAKNSYIEPFAYTLRNMEYKQRVHQASGALANGYLDGWLNVVDTPNDFRNNDVLLEHIDPILLRSQAYEFDKYFSTLNGYSLGTYFHFIVVFHNKNEITRPMAVAPEILS